MESPTVIRQTAELQAREWGAGMPEPYEGSWLHDFGVAIIFVFPAMALLTVGLRLYGRIKLRQLWWGELLILRDLEVGD
jgi:hypothetical protein